MPYGLCPEKDAVEGTTAGEETGEAVFGGEVSGLLAAGVGFVLEGADDRLETLRRTDRGARDDSVAGMDDVADDGVPCRGEPALDAGIQDLVGGGVVAVAEHQAPRLGPLPRQMGRRGMVRLGHGLPSWNIAVAERAGYKPYFSER